MRRVLQRVVCFVPFAFFDELDFAVDGNHRVAETVQLGLVFALGRLDHQRAGHGPRERWRVEAVIHQALRHVLGGHELDGHRWRDEFHESLFRFGLGTRVARPSNHDAAQIQNTLMRHGAVRAFVEHGEIFLQSSRDIIRGEDGDLRGFGEPVGSHQADVNPRDS